ncbi:MAG: hypothetical protein ABI761_17865 [Saprospiraceae bacterium]
MKHALTILILIISTISFVAQTIQLNKSALRPVSVEISEATYKGKQGVRIVGTRDTNHFDEMAIVQHSEFRNGIIELEMSGDRLMGSDTTYRGFVGVAFRVKEADRFQYECFYLRPTNGRANDQLRRNHSTQYISSPGYPWQKLRKENPGVYESYVDMIAGEWTKVKIIVKDQYAALYVNNALQPCLIVNDLKQNMVEGPVALWIGVGTEAYFRDLKITRDKN